MANTIYAAFSDASLAEKAVGALLDHGARAEDISLVRSHSDEFGSTGHTTTTYGTTVDRDNDLKDAGDAALGGTKSVGNRMAEYGDRVAGGVADAIGADNAAAGYRAAAERRDDLADHHAVQADRQFDDAIDNPNRPSDYTSTTVNMDNPGGYSGGQALSDISAADADRTSNANVGYGTTQQRIDNMDNADHTEDSAKHGISTTTGADAGAGAMKGAGVGLGLGILAGLASLFVPGVGLVVGGGALAAALGGAAATTAAGAVAGGVTGYLKDQGVDAHIAADYDDAVKNGGALLSINVPSGDCDEARVREVISKYGASNVNAYATRGYMA